MPILVVSIVGTCCEITTLSVRRSFSITDSSYTNYGPHRVSMRRIMIFAPHWGGTNRLPTCFAATGIGLSGYDEPFSHEALDRMY